MAVAAAADPPTPPAQDTLPLPFAEELCKWVVVAVCDHTPYGEGATREVHQALFGPGEPNPSWLSYAGRRAPRLSGYLCSALIHALSLRGSNLQGDSIDRLEYVLRHPDYIDAAEMYGTEIGVDAVNKATRCSVLVECLSNTLSTRRDLGQEQEDALYSNYARLLALASDETIRNSSEQLWSVMRTMSVSRSVSNKRFECLRRAILSRASPDGGGLQFKAYRRVLYGIGSLLHESNWDLKEREESCHQSIVQAFCLANKYRVGLCPAVAAVLQDAATPVPTELISLVVACVLWPFPTPLAAVAAEAATKDGASAMPAAAITAAAEPGSS